MRGWLSAIAKERTLLRQIITYRELTDLFDFFAKFNIISLSAEAVHYGYSGANRHWSLVPRSARVSRPRRLRDRRSAVRCG